MPNQAAFEREATIGEDRSAEVAIADPHSERPTRQDITTVEGCLETVSIRDEPHFVVCDALTHERIACAVTAEQFSQWSDRIGQRIAVTGRLTLQGDRPVRMVAELIQGLRDRSELPQPRALAPINITDGRTSEEHIGSIRNG
jgi:hypothetical protein